MNRQASSIRALYQRKTPYASGNASLNPTDNPTLAQVVANLASLNRLVRHGSARLVLVRLLEEFWPGSQRFRYIQAFSPKFSATLHGIGWCDPTNFQDGAHQRPPSRPETVTQHRPEPSATSPKTQSSQSAKIQAAVVSIVWEHRSDSRVDGRGDGR